MQSGKGMSLGGLICGIVSLVFAWFFSWAGFGAVVGLIAGIVGVILSVMGGKKSKLAGEPSGLATAGLVVSIIGLVFSGIFFITCTICTGCIACSGKGIVDQINSELSSLQ